MCNFQGCQCYWETASLNCGCCKTGGCQCGPSYPERCIKCGGEWAHCVADTPKTTTIATTKTTETYSAPYQTCGNRVLVPLYVWPSDVDFFTDTCNNDIYKKAAEGKDKVISIINPNNGKGVEGEELKRFQVCTKLLKNGGNSVLAYVYTNYGKRSRQDIERDIDNYFIDFGESLLDGFFLDETMSIYQPNYIEKYANLAEYIRSKFQTKDPIMIGNPGSSPHYQTIEVSGLSSVVAFEQPFSNSQAPCNDYKKDTIWCKLSSNPLITRFVNKTTSGNIAPNQVSSMIYATEEDELDSAIEVALQSYSGISKIRLIKHFPI